MKTHRRVLQLAAIALVVGLLAAACGSSKKDNTSGGSSGTTETTVKLTKSELVIGQVSPGVNNPQAGGQGTTEDMDSLAAWAKWTNAHGGINGHPVRIVTAVTDGDAAKATAAVHKLVEQDKVLAIVGQEDTATEPSWADYIKQQGVPVVGGENYTATSFSNPMWFMSNTTVLSLLYGQIAKFKSANADTYGAISCAEVAACSQAIPLIKSKAPKSGVKFVFDTTVSATQPDYTSACVAANQAGVKGLQLNGVPVDRVVRDCDRQGFKFVYGIVSEAEAQLKIPALEGAVGNLPAFPAFYVGPETKDFHAAMKQYMPKLTPTVVSSSSWTAGLLFAAALKNAPETVTRQTVLDGLYGLKDETLGGLAPQPLNYGPAGKANPQLMCYYLFGIKGGKYVAPQGIKPECEPAG